jgi:hypothetical protein
VDSPAATALALAKRVAAKMEKRILIDVGDSRVKFERVSEDEGAEERCVEGFRGILKRMDDRSQRVQVRVGRWRLLGWREKGRERKA